MQGIHPKTCIHHIYIDDHIKPVRQPQRRMNPMMKEIVEEELQKLLQVGFIYTIFDSQWVSPLVLVSKKNGKWRIFVDVKLCRCSMLDATLLFTYSNHINNQVKC